MLVWNSNKQWKIKQLHKKFKFTEKQQKFWVGFFLVLAPAVFRFVDCQITEIK